MKEFLGDVGVVAFWIALVVGMMFGAYYGYSYFRPKYVAVDNKVFHESQQYNDGMVRDLENLRMAYLRGSPEQKDALRATILHRFAVYPQERMTPELQLFYNQLRNGS